MLTSIVHKALLLGKDTKSYLPMILLADLPIMTYLIATNGVSIFMYELSYLSFTINLMIMLTSVLSQISTFQLQRFVSQDFQNESKISIFAKLWIFSRTGFYLTALTLYIMTMIFSFVFFMFYLCINVCLVVLTCSGIVFYKRVMDEIRLGEGMSEDMVEKSGNSKGIIGRLF